MYILRSGGGYLLLIYRYTLVCNNSGEFTRLSSASAAESQLAGDPLAGRTVREPVCEKYAASWRCTPTSGWATLSSWTRSIWSSLSRTSRSGESSSTHCPQVCQSLQRRVCIHKQCTLYTMPQCRSFLVLYILYYSWPLPFRIANLYAICIFHGSYMRNPIPDADKIYVFNVKRS